MPKPMTSVESKVEPNPSLEKRSRRVFTADYKLSIIQQADACKHGELGALLRREKLYSNQLAQWRRELAEDGLAGLSKSSPGPTPKKSVEQKRIEQLEKEIARLRRQMAVKDGRLMLQKKSLSAVGQLGRQEVMMNLVENALPIDVSERAACDALALCRNTLRATRARHHLCGPVNPYGNHPIFNSSWQ